ncbi:hypothetical protein EXIGLDRAFT_257129 [Exidia glandulosa HHB12029]|uniref:Uncharacterized protein n=1 Tax=Exidia glandulosa HHB12029 TaxID=1314781 RepID=A0A165ZS05_EXIGL|nr:hypothetical protein EXIGLDRAFT_257129 [Exidia glandulosa HHB12029]
MVHITHSQVIENDTDIPIGRYATDRCEFANRSFCAVHQVPHWQLQKDVACSK